MSAFQQRQYLTGSYISFLHPLFDVFTPADPVRVMFSQIIDDLPGRSFCQRKLIYSLRFSVAHESPIKLTPIILIGCMHIVNHCYLLTPQTFGVTHQDQGSGLTASGPWLLVAPENPLFSRLSKRCSFAATESWF
jgi:hypothetical protein